MGRSTPDPQGQNPQDGEQQPYTYTADLQAQGDWTGPASVLPDPRLDNLLGGHLEYAHEPQGRTRFGAAVHIGNGDITPMKIAAIAIGMNLFMVGGAIAAIFMDYPGTAFAVFLLVFLQVAAAICLAFYESGTRRRAATATTITAHKPAVIVPTTPAEIEKIDVKPEVVREPLPDEPIPPRALDGGEPVA